MYLDFLKLNEFLDHCIRLKIKTLYSELTMTQGEPGEYGLRTITFWAAFTQQHGNIILCCFIQVGQTTNFSLKQQKDNPEGDRYIDKVRTSFEEVKQGVRNQDFNVIPGKLTHETPDPLKFQD